MPLPTGAKKQATEAQGTTAAGEGASPPAPDAADDRAAKRSRPLAKGSQGANGSSSNGVGEHGQAAQQQQQQEVYVFEDDGTALYDEGYGEPESGAGEQGAGQGLASVLPGLAAGTPEAQADDVGGRGAGKSVSTPGSAGKRPR